MEEEVVTNQTVVIDNGSGLIKAGFAGNTKPTVLLPACVGRPKYQRCMAGANECDFYTGNKARELKGLLRLSYPSEHGVITGWDDIELLWTALYSELKASPQEHPVLLTEPPLNPRKNRERMLETFFETYNAPAVFVSIQAVLSLYASGRTSGVVLDVGDGVAHVVPVVEGFALMHSIKRADVAGRDVTEYLSQLLRSAGKAFHTSTEMEIVQDIKETACYVNISPVRDEMSRDQPGTDKAVTARVLTSSTTTTTPYTYQLPDGTQINIGAERCRAPEILFNPSLIGLEYPGVHQLLAASIARTDIELRKELSAQIVLSGGSTMFSGFVDRLLSEMRRLQPKDSLIRLYAPPERQLATFMGGAILGSLSTFKKLWVTKSEYEEDGPSVIFRKGF